MPNTELFARSDRASIIGEFSLTSTFRIRIAHLLKTALENTKIKEALLEDALRLEEDMVREGLDIDVLFVKLLEVICVVCYRLEKVEESEKYRVAYEEVQNSCRSLQ